MAQEQGMEKFGGAVVYRPTAHDRVALRLDLATVLLPDLADDSAFRAYRRNRYHGQYRHAEARWSAQVDGTYGQHRDDAGARGPYRYLWERRDRAVASKRMPRASRWQPGLSTGTRTVRFCGSMHRPGMSFILTSATTSARMLTNS